MFPQVEKFFVKGPQKDRKYNDYKKKDKKINNLHANVKQNKHTL